MKQMLLLFLLLFLLAGNMSGQKPPVYVDKAGVLKWTDTKKEAAFFGVNYTTPFAHAYRAHKALNADMEEAIRLDVYHFARLGLDAFRVHVWDTEISDTLGNLLENEHLRLFDFLLAELKKRNIKTIVTPIAFWGNGYPERDEATPGFARKYGKGRSTTNDSAITAQENYLRQFFSHVNPYTGLSYGQDPDIIAMEINNEPSHSGAKSGVTEYINRLAAATRSQGWAKPVYYNIAQSPFYADAVAKANIDGVSFQWYPTGLVANREAQGNFLPHVDQYTIPFDTIPEYRNKSRMVYEFDAADVLQPYLYPAIARSFRSAGMQWATQFAYDPTAIAYANTEYQTHYLNLAYTPSKAISLLIASKVFHRVPRLKTYAGYPADSCFDDFCVSYKSSLSIMNSEEEFYYSNSTLTSPRQADRLSHIAGVGSSPVVQYEGSGAYFLDKIQEGVWRLEVMPDAIHIRDPFERASPKKEVTRIQWRTNRMKIVLPGLGTGFSVRPLNSGNKFVPSVTGDSFQIRPGTYFISAGPKSIASENIAGLNIRLKEFGGPPSTREELYLRHEPFTQVTAGKSFPVFALVAAPDSVRVSLQTSRPGGGFGSFRNIPMKAAGAGRYKAEIPADIVTPGLINYRIVLQNGDEFAVFPGNHKTSPFAWDNYNNEWYKTFVAASNGQLEIYNPSTDQSLTVYPGFRRGFQTGYGAGEESGQLVLRLWASEAQGDPTIGFQHFFAEKISGRISELPAFTQLVIRGSSIGPIGLTAKVTLIDKDGFAFSSVIRLDSVFRDLAVPLESFVADSSLLLPRPYPGFMRLWHNGEGSQPFRLENMEKIQVTAGHGMSESERKNPYGVEVGRIWLSRSARQ